jgi:2-iminobutanoate/2-iminopropanoate deaminase
MLKRGMFRSVSLGAAAVAAAAGLWMTQSAGAAPTAAADVIAQEASAQEDIAYIGNGRFLTSVVKVGRTLYLSGQLGLGGERGITPETRAAMESIKELLEANGATMDDVVKCTVFLADFAEWGAMNEVYAPYFEKHRPARSAVAVSGMAANARVEIECMAVIGARNAE